MQGYLQLATGLSLNVARGAMKMATHVLLMMQPRCLLHLLLKNTHLCSAKRDHTGQWHTTHKGTISKGYKYCKKLLQMLAYMCGSNYLTTR